MHITPRHHTFKLLNNINGLCIHAAYAETFALAEKLGVGQRDIALHFGGVAIAPGDYIYADNNGVLVSKVPLTGG